MNSRHLRLDRLVVPRSLVDVVRRDLADGDARLLERARDERRAAERVADEVDDAVDSVVPRLLQVPLGSTRAAC